MKNYTAPTMRESLFEPTDVIAASGDGIVSIDDAEGASETQESSWNDSWD